MFTQITKLVATMAMVAAIEASAADAQLPPTDGEIMVEAQEWPLKPGLRTVVAKVHYPMGTLKAVKKTTGMLATLHNWGGKGSEGTADPVVLANKLNVIAITVDYLQSGDEAFGPLPYDHGLYQAVDVLRVLHAAWSDLKRRKIKWDSKRIYAVGGSGGGNVALMANRLAPRTFAAILAMSAPMRMEQEGPLDARWQIVPLNEYEIRDLTTTRKGWPRPVGAVQLVHGDADAVTPFQNAVSAITALPANLFAVITGIFWGPFQNAQHDIGDRTQIALQFPALFAKQRRNSKTDFDMKDTRVRYPVTGGAWVVDYKRVPTLKWVGR